PNPRHRLLAALLRRTARDSGRPAPTRRLRGRRESPRAAPDRGRPAIPSGGGGRARGKWRGPAERPPAQEARPAQAERARAARRGASGAAAAGPRRVAAVARGAWRRHRRDHRPARRLSRVTGAWLGTRRVADV